MTPKDQARQPKSRLSTRANAVLKDAAPGFALRWNKTKKCYALVVVQANGRETVLDSVQECGWCDGFVVMYQGGWSRCSSCGAL